MWLCTQRVYEFRLETQGAVKIVGIVIILMKCKKKRNNKINIQLLDTETFENNQNRLVRAWNLIWISNKNLMENKRKGANKFNNQTLERAFMH